MKMNESLASYTASHDNNFNLIRFVAATLVLVSHSFVLAGYPDFGEPLESLVGLTWGSLAVDFFFITSGFLVTSSYLSKDSFFGFARARIIRIYPALIVAVLFSVVIIGLYFTTLNAGAFLSDSKTHQYILKNSFLFDGVKYNLPGVFLDNPYRQAVNGSLWTLPYEVKMYSYLALLLCTISYLKRSLGVNVNIKTAILVIYLITGALNIHNHFYVDEKNYFIHLAFMFFSGALFYLWREKIMLSINIFAICTLLLIISIYHPHLFFVVYSLSIPLIVLFLAYIPKGAIRSYNKIGDYSYGMYIYAFPIQQALAATIDNITISTMLGLSFVLTLVMAVASWHIVEKPMLKFK
jgi:peptidoglycan/LPS O-acetylase OafA/YrhL